MQYLTRDLYRVAYTCHRGWLRSSVISVAVVPAARLLAVGDLVFAEAATRARNSPAQRCSISVVASDFLPAV